MTELNPSQDLADDISTIDSLRELAIDHGFAYRDADSSLVDRWGAPPFSGFGHRRALDVVTTEREGFPVVAFRFMIGELARTAGAESSFGGGLKLSLPEIVDGYLVVAAALPSPLPRFALAPQEGAVDEVPYGHGFESEDGDLAERYDVYAADPETAGAVLHLDAVAKIREHRTVDWRVEGRDVLVVDPLGDGERSVEDILATVDAVVTIAKGVSSDAYAQFKAPSAYPPPA
ncbi:MAG: hypothetical protein ACRDUA_09510 [Micromonosporaceae bacterium]